MGKLRELATELVAGAGGGGDVTKTLAARGMLNLLRLRSANKALAHETEDLKEETAKAKAALEQGDLALQVIRSATPSSFCAPSCHPCQRLVALFIY